MQNRTKVIAINAISGGGKTTITKELVKCYSNAEALYFDDRDYDLESGISDIGKWMSEGADANEFHLELFAEDMEKILQLSPDYLFLDYPFGYRHERIKPYIDSSFFIDVPLDLALTRRLLRDYSDQNSGALLEELSFYETTGRKIYQKSIEISKGDADYVIDGMGSIQDVVDEIRTHIK